MSASASPRAQPRIVLRHPVGTDRAEVAALLNQSRDHLIPWWSTTPRHDDEGFDPETSFDRILSTARLESSMRFLICLKATGAVAGAISVSNIARGPFESCTLGYWLGAPYTGQGLVTEAMALVLKFVFRDLKLHRCEANIMPRNEASTKLVQKFGFRHEGVGLRYIRINYVWEDHARWAMTAEDYEALASAGKMLFSDLPGRAIQF